MSLNFIVPASLVAIPAKNRQEISKHLPELPETAAQLMALMPGRVGDRLTRTSLESILMPS
jgi:hypothetical protein